MPPSKANRGGSNRPRRPREKRRPALSPVQTQPVETVPAEASPQLDDSAAGKLRAVRVAGAVPASARLTRDYGYVRGELARIAVLAVVIFSAIGALAAVSR